MPWPAYDSTVDTPPVWPSYEDCCICKAMDAGADAECPAPSWHSKAAVRLDMFAHVMSESIQGEVLFSLDVSATAVCHDRPLGNTCCASDNAAGAAGRTNCSVGLKAEVCNPMLFQSTRAQPSINELESPSRSKGLALQDPRVSCDTHPSHGRGRQRYTQMHDDKSVARTWIGTWELLDQNLGNC